MSEAVVLLIEDNLDDALLAQTALEGTRKIGSVIHSPDGADALDYLFCKGVHSEREPLLPDLVLLDLKLPKIGGLTVLEKIRQDARTALLPVIILTTSAEPGDIRNSYRLGANSYIRKPVDYTRFVEIAHKVTDYWLDLNIPPYEGSSSSSGR